MPIRAVFVATVAVLLFVTSGIIIVSSYVTSERVLLGMAHTVLEGFSKDVESKVEGFLSPAEKLVKLSRGVVNYTMVTRDETDAAERYFIELLRLFPQLAGLYYGNTKGEFFYVKRDDEKSEGGFRTKVIAPHIGAGKARMIWRDKTLVEIERTVETDDFDPRTRPWFRKAKTDLTWTAPYIFFSSRKPGVTTAYPLIDENGVRQGVVGVDIELDQLSAFLADLDLGDSGSAFILGKSGEVIAFPNRDLVQPRQDSDRVKPRFLKIEELVDPASKAAYLSFIKKIDREGEKETTFTSFRVEGEVHHGAFVRFPNPSWPWIIGIYLPEDDFLGGVKKALYANIMVVLVITFAAVIVGLLIAQNITRPIIELRNKAIAMAKGDFDLDLDSESAFKETNNMIDAFRDMINGLKEYESKNKELTDGLKGSRASLETMVAERTRQLLLAKEMAEDATQAKSRVLAAASHDLRQPLQALTLFSDALAMGTHDAKQHKLVEKIRSTVGALDGMLELLLEISKLDAGLVQAKMSSFRLDGLFSRLADEFQSLTRERGLRLKFVIPNDLFVFSDRVLLERILRNLLTNAMRYTQEGRILFGCRRIGKAVRIEVWDTGVGIAEDQRAKIFGDFYQVDNQARNRRKGFGLGLSIVSRLSVLIDAELDVKSTYGKGSVFSVTVPLGEKIVEEAEPAENPVESPRNYEEARRSAMILVIDDEPDILVGMCQLVELWGHEVLSALSSEDALETVARSSKAPELIIADYRLAAGDRGDQAIERVRTLLGEEIPAVLVTGDTTAERLAEASKTNLTVLHKPVPTDQLRQLIEDVVERTA